MGTSSKTPSAPIGLAREPRSPRLQTLICMWETGSRVQVVGSLTWAFPEGWVTGDSQPGSNYFLATFLLCGLGCTA